MGGVSVEAYRRSLGVSGLLPSAQPQRKVEKAVQFGKYFAYRHEIALSALARGSRDTIGIDGESDFELRKVSVLADNRGVGFQMILTPLQEAFQSLPSFLSHYGSGQRPFVVNPSMVLKRSSQFSGVFDDRRLIQVGTNNITIAYHGAKVYASPIVLPRRYDLAKPYIPYLAKFTGADGSTAVPALGTSTFNLRTDSDSDFEVQKITICSDGPILLQITSDQDNWFRNPLPGELLGAQNIETVAGGGPDGFSGEFPFVLPAPRFITAAAYITTEVTDLSGAENRVEVGYHGVRLYPAGGR